MGQSLLVDRKKRFTNNLLAAISGVFLFISFPNYNLGFFAWFAIVPVLLSLNNKDSNSSFKSGFVMGLVFYCFTLSWVVNTMIHYGNLSLLVSYSLLFILAAYLSLFFGAFTFILSRIPKDNRTLKWISAPIVWTALEYVRSWLFTGFPWASLGYSQYKFITIIQISDITGFYGISFLIVLVNSTLALSITSFTMKNSVKSYSMGKNQRNLRPVIICIMFFLLCLVYGLLRTEEHMTSENKENYVYVKVIQGNIEQDVKWDKNYREEVFNIYKDLTLENSSIKKPDLIVWPETATPFYFDTNKEYKKKMLKLSESAASNLFFGSPRYTYNEDDKVIQFNSAYLLSDKTKIKGFYDKIHLVPFGEYVPLSKLLWFVEKMVEGIGEFKEGTEYKVFSLDEETKFSSLICFEVIFPDLVRKFVKKGAKFIVNITNDAWFGKTAASAQHMSMVVFRAIENRTPVVRAANTGISGFINSLGVIEEESEIFVKTSISRDIYPKVRTNTIYTEYGDVFAIICTLLFSFIGLYAILGRGR